MGDVSVHILEFSKCSFALVDALNLDLQPLPKVGASSYL